jgi:aspartate aminotransferase
MFLNNKVSELQKDGQKILNLTVGQPDMPTPEIICDAAIKAIKQGKHGYTPANGILELRQAVAKKYKLEIGYNYDPKTEVMIGVGAKELIYNALLSIVDDGDEVIVLTPCWASYVEQIKLAGGKPILVELLEHDKLDIKKIETSTTSKTKAIIINYPNNPTGAVYSKNDLQKLADFVTRKNLILISDEMYEKITFDFEFISIASLNEDIRKRTVTINGVSKAYAMTGWRLGFAVGPKEIIQGMSSLESQTTSNTSVISQWAALEALENAEKEAQQFTQIFKKRKDILIKAFQEIPEIEFNEPQGAFYLFLDLRKILSKQKLSSADWCQQLLEQKKVAIVPGEAFLAPGFARLSFAVGEEILTEAVQKIKDFVKI